MFVTFNAMQCGGILGVFTDLIPDDLIDDEEESLIISGKGSGKGEGKGSDDTEVSGKGSGKGSKLARRRRQQRELLTHCPEDLELVRPSLPEGFDIQAWRENLLPLSLLGNTTVRSDSNVTIPYMTLQNSIGSIYVYMHTYIFFLLTTIHCNLNFKLRFFNHRSRLNN